MSSKKIPSPQLLDVKAYIADLTRTVDKAKTRINLITLILVDDTDTHALVEALIKAAGRGVTVTIATDVFAYGELGGYFSPFQRLAPKSRAMSAMVKRLEAAGASFTWLGSSFKLNPFGGVTHLKWTVVDNVTYCFGGVNLYGEGIESVDYMFKFSHPTLADEISEQHQAIIKNHTLRTVYPDHTTKGSYGTIHIDSGERHRSIIYDRLVELASKATHVLVVTQYCPSGPLAHHLQGKSDIYYNQPNQTPFPVSLLIKYGEIRTNLYSQYMRPLYLHAKFMVFTMPGGKKIAVTGSHNFSYSGVMFGTREVALETSNTDIIKQLEQFHQEHVANFLD